MNAADWILCALMLPAWAFILLAFLPWLEEAREAERLEGELRRKVELVKVSPKDRLLRAILETIYP